MLQVVLQQPGSFVAHDVPLPCVAPGQALVRVRRIGVCGTDLHAFAGRQPFFDYPRILGHELGVEVLEVAAKTDVSATGTTTTTPIKPGDRCAVEPYVRCGNCRACRAGRYNCCQTLACLGVHADGGMREQICLPLELLHPSRSLSFDQLALVETLGIGAHAVARASLQPGERVLIVGAGPIGLATVQFALDAGAVVHVLEPDPARRQFVAGWGTTVHDSLAAGDVELFDAVFDATGNASSMAASLHHVAHGGHVVFVGLTLGTVAIDDPLLHRREITLLASRNSCHEFPRIIRKIESGELDTQPWITHRLSLANVPREFAALRGTPGLVKAMIDVDG